MSHELRTPLNAILGFSEIMKDQHLGPVNNPRYLSYAGDIYASGRHLLGIINDLLDLSKIEAGKMSLDSADEFELTPCVRAALAMMAGLGEKYGVRTVVGLSEDGARLVAVERMVRQIVINLVGNAIKFTPAGGSIHVENGPSPDGHYVLVVRDSGIGMTEKEIANALVPFGQNRTKMTAKHDGTGLGLPLAKAMLELHGGSLAIASRPAEGTTVTLHSPAGAACRQEIADRRGLTGRVLGAPPPVGAIPLDHHHADDGNFVQRHQGHRQAGHRESVRRRREHAGHRHQGDDGIAAHVA